MNMIENSMRKALQALSGEWIAGLVVVLAGISKIAENLNKM